jgi:hypothetical protein
MGCLMPMPTKAAQREYQRRWMAARRAEALEGASCVDCGSVDSLELDHRDRSEKVSHRIWSWSRDRMLAELAKCDWRCVACHRVRHAEERKRHGVSRYRAGCRCETCRAAKRESNRRYQENLKRRGRNSNPGERLCRPLHNHSATAPGGADVTGPLREAA